LMPREFRDKKQDALLVWHRVHENDGCRNGGTDVR
jgi:hypothetical protein